ncbi:MAG TPA: MFS transporter [Candidatus Limosilactobacillus faecipullorum]|nr:MFS transporter [Candidatus Limosilactobacillus faecipullorum]
MRKEQLRAIIFVMVAFMLGCNEYVIVGVLPDVAKEYHVSLASLGYVVTIFAFVYALTTPVITSLANRWPRHRVLFTLIAIFLIGNTWTAMATNYWSLILSRMLTATVAGAIISLVLVIASFVARPEKRASLVSWIFAGFSIASVIGVPIGTLVSQHLTWHDSFWMITWLTLMVLVLLFWLVPRDTPQVKGHIADQFVIFKDRRVLAGISFIMAVCAADYTFYTYIRPLITNVLGFNDTWLNWLLLVMGVFFIIGNKFGGFLADNGGVKKLPWMYVAMTILLVLMAPSFRWPWVTIAIIALVCIALAGYGASTQLMFLNIAEKEYPQALDLASSLNSIFANIGISLGSLTAAETVQFLGLTKVGYVAAIYGVIATILIVLVAKWRDIKVK